MTEAQIKAKELVDKYRPLVRFMIPDDTEDAKQCALIAVNEKIETLQNIIGHQKHMWTSDEAEYWQYLQFVKEEINKL